MAPLTRFAHAHKHLIFFVSQILWLVYADLIVQFFILQLSVTLGIMFSYLLGMFVPWRLLAVIGIVANPDTLINLLLLLLLLCTSTLSCTVAVSIVK